MNNVLDDENDTSNGNSSESLDDSTVEESPIKPQEDTIDVTTEDTTESDIPERSLKEVFSDAVANADTLLTDVFERNQYMDIFVRMFASFFTVCLYNLTNVDEDFDTLAFPRNVSIGRFIVFILAVYIILTLVKRIVKNLKISVNTDGYFLGASIMLYGLTTVVRDMNVYYAVGVSLVVSICLIFLMGKGYFKEFETLSKLQAKVIVGVFSISAIVFISTFCIYRYLIFTTSCFDFGIFSQMYYYLVHTFLPNTTCERNEFLSHFAVHFSPIYYVLVPIYAVFQSPKTLLVCQAIVVESGVIPLYLICKNFKFSNASTMAMCVVYVFSPAYIMSCFFDFHENKFLVPLILWVLWAMETGHIKWMYVFTVLTLFVKEDAFIYVVCISLFMITSNKKYFNKKVQKEVSLRGHGILIAGIGLLYFYVVSSLMDKYGLGIMQDRYSNVMIDPTKGIFNVVVTALLDPALAISECFQEDKFIFFLEMTLPLLFLPFASKKISHIFLLVPFFVVNLLSGNPYQNQIGYQYVCGVMSLLMYASVLNLAEMKTTPKKYAVTASMCISMVLGTMFASNKLYYYELFCRDGERIHNINHIISEIPDDASVECTTYYLPQLSQRMEVYMMEEPDSIDYPETDFVLIRPNEDYSDERIEELVSNGYEFYDGYEQYVYLFVKTSYLEKHPDMLDAQRDTPRKNY